MRYFKSAMSCSTKGTFYVVKKQTYHFTQFYAPDSYKYQQKRERKKLNKSRYMRIERICCTKNCLIEEK